MTLEEYKLFTANEEKMLGKRLPNSPTKQRIISILNIKFVEFLMLFATLFALFAADINLMYGNDSTDIGMSIANIIVMFLFASELVCYCYALPGYFCSTFFFLDFLATVSIIGDIHWIAQGLTLTGFAGDHSVQTCIFSYFHD